MADNQQSDQPISDRPRNVTPSNRRDTAMQLMWRGLGEVLAVLNEEAANRQTQPAGVIPLPPETPAPPATVPAQPAVPPSTPAAPSLVPLPREPTEPRASPATMPPMPPPTAPLEERVRVATERMEARVGIPLPKEPDEDLAASIEERRQKRLAKVPGSAAEDRAFRAAAELSEELFGPLPVIPLPEEPDAAAKGPEPAVPPVKEKPAAVIPLPEDEVAPVAPHSPRAEPLSQPPLATMLPLPPDEEPEQPAAWTMTPEIAMARQTRPIISLPPPESPERIIAIQPRVDTGGGYDGHKADGDLVRLEYKLERYIRDTQKQKEQLYKLVGRLIETSESDGQRIAELESALKRSRDGGITSYGAY